VTLGALHFVVIVSTLAAVGTLFAFVDLLISAAIYLGLGLPDLISGAVKFAVICGALSIVSIGVLCIAAVRPKIATSLSQALVAAAWRFLLIPTKIADSLFSSFPSLRNTAHWS
jgi:hypothetical protein